MTINKSNRAAVADYHKKMTNLATIRVPSVEECGKDFLQIIRDELAKRAPEGEKPESINSYILGLIEKDMNIEIPRGVKSVRRQTND